MKAPSPEKIMKGDEMKILRKLPPAEIIEDLLLIGMSTSYLWQFGCIWFEGVFCFQEPNIAIRVLETCMFVAILVFGVRRFIKLCRKGER